MISKKLFIILSCLLAGCASQKVATSSTTKPSASYSEDLTPYRPKAQLAIDAPSIESAESFKRKNYVTAQHHVNAKLDMVLDSIGLQHRARGYVEGYSIQVFTGEKAGAMTTKRRLTMNIPDLPSEIKYEPPTFRVKVGTYYTALDAQRDFALVKEYFPDAILVPQKIGIN